MTVDYVESSALAKLVSAEPERSALAEHLGTTRFPVTSLLSVSEEFRRAEEVLSGLVVLSLDRALMAQAGKLMPPSLRKLDAIHVASAQLLGSDLRAVVTYDARLADAARAAGLPVVSPGA